MRIGRSATRVQKSASQKMSDTSRDTHEGDGTGFPDRGVQQQCAYTDYMVTSRLHEAVSDVFAQCDAVLPCQRLRSEP